MNPLWQQAKEYIDAASYIVVIQAENPDGDSMGSALALEEILGEQGKKVTLFCAVDVPKYLRYLRGWDRVVKDLPRDFDLSIVVDASSQSLLDKTLSPENSAQLKKAPCIVFDHHGEVATADHLDKLIPQTLVINEPNYVATGELLYEWAYANSLTVNAQGAEHLVIAIMADTLGLATEATRARTLRIVAELMDLGASLSDIDDRRRQFMKKSPAILDYKGQLLQRIEYHLDNQLAMVRIPWEETQKYSDEYNPAALVIDEMRLVIGVRVALVTKTYPDGKLTGKLRTNKDGAVADQIAAHFGGGGHPYAAGFKVYADNYDDIKPEIIATVREQLEEYDQHETI